MLPPVQSANGVDRLLLPWGKSAKTAALHPQKQPMLITTCGRCRLRVISGFRRDRRQHPYSLLTDVVGAHWNVSGGNQFILAEGLNHGFINRVRHLPLAKTMIESAAAFVMTKV
jgi:hypothetical protein